MNVLALSHKDAADDPGSGLCGHSILQQTNCCGTTPGSVLQTYMQSGTDEQPEFPPYQVGICRPVTQCAAGV